MDHERVKRRVAGRKQAESILGLVDLPHADCVDAFLDELRRTLCPAEVAVKADARGAAGAGLMQKFWTITLSFPEAAACQRAAVLGADDDLVTEPDRERLRRIGNAQKPVELERFELLNLASDLERVAGHKADREADALSIRLMAVLGTTPHRTETPVKKPVVKHPVLFE